MHLQKIAALPDSYLAIVSAILLILLFMPTTCVHLNRYKYHNRKISYFPTRAQKVDIRLNKLSIAYKDPK